MLHRVEQLGLCILSLWIICAHRRGAVPFYEHFFLANGKHISDDAIAHNPERPEIPPENQQTAFERFYISLQLTTHHTIPMSNGEDNMVTDA